MSNSIGNTRSIKGDKSNPLTALITEKKTSTRVSRRRYKRWVTNRTRSSPETTLFIFHCGKIFPWVSQKHDKHTLSFFLLQAHPMCKIATIRKTKFPTENHIIWKKIQPIINSWTSTLPIRCWSTADLIIIPEKKLQWKEAKYAHRCCAFSDLSSNTSI